MDIDDSNTHSDYSDPLPMEGRRRRRAPDVREREQSKASRTKDAVVQICPPSQPLTRHIPAGAIRPRRRAPLGVRHSRTEKPHAPSAEHHSPEIYNSITATPGLSEWCFEEMRIEAYLQSYRATGRAPAPLPPDAPEWKILPPAYAPFMDDGRHSALGSDREMSAAEWSSSPAITPSKSFDNAFAFTFDVPQVVSPHAKGCISWC